MVYYTLDTEQRAVLENNPYVEQVIINGEEHPTYKTNIFIRYNQNGINLRNQMRRKRGLPARLDNRDDPHYQTIQDIPILPHDTDFSVNYVQHVNQATGQWSYIDEYVGSDISNVDMEVYTWEEQSLDERKLLATVVICLILALAIAVTFLLAVFVQYLKDRPYQCDYEERELTECKMLIRGHDCVWHTFDKCADEDGDGVNEGAFTDETIDAHKDEGPDYITMIILGGCVLGGLLIVSRMDWSGVKVGGGRKTKKKKGRPKKDTSSASATVEHGAGNDSSSYTVSY